MNHYSALKLLLLAGTCIYPLHDLLAQTKYGDGSGIGATNANGVMVGGNGGGAVTYGGQGGGAENGPSVDPTVQGNGGNGANASHIKGGGKGGELGGIINSSSDPMPTSNSVNGAMGSFTADSGGGAAGCGQSSMHQNILLQLQ